MWWLSGILQKIPIKCARVGRKNKDGTVGKPRYIFFWSYSYTHDTGTCGVGQRELLLKHLQ